MRFPRPPLSGTLYRATLTMLAVLGLLAYIAGAIALGWISTRAGAP